MFFSLFHFADLLTNGASPRRQVPHIVMANLFLSWKRRPWHALFDTRPYALDAWLIMIPIALAFGFMEEARKMFVRKY